MGDWRQQRRAYLVGAVLVWLSLIGGAAILLAGTSYALPVLAILGGGAAYFLVVVPSWLFRAPGRATPGSAAQ